MKGIEFIKSLSSDRFSINQDLNSQDKYLIINKKTGRLLWIWGQVDYDDEAVKEYKELLERS